MKPASSPPKHSLPARHFDRPHEKPLVVDPEMVEAPLPLHKISTHRGSGGLTAEVFRVAPGQESRISVSDRLESPAWTLADKASRKTAACCSFCGRVIPVNRDVPWRLRQGAWMDREVGFGVVRQLCAECLDHLEGSSDQAGLTAKPAVASVAPEPPVTPEVVTMQCRALVGEGQITLLVNRAQLEILRQQGVKRVAFQLHH